MNHAPRPIQSIVIALIILITVSTALAQTATTLPISDFALTATALAQTVTSPSVSDFALTATALRGGGASTGRATLQTTRTLTLPGVSDFALTATALSGGNSAATDVLTQTTTPSPTPSSTRNVNIVTATPFAVTRAVSATNPPVVTTQNTTQEIVSTATQSPSTQAPTTLSTEPITVTVGASTLEPNTPAVATSERTAGAIPMTAAATGNLSLTQMTSIVRTPDRVSSGTATPLSTANATPGSTAQTGVIITPSSNPIALTPVPTSQETVFATALVSMTMTPNAGVMTSAALPAGADATATEQYRLTPAAPQIDITSTGAPTAALMTEEAVSEATAFIAAPGEGGEATPIFVPSNNASGTTDAGEAGGVTTLVLLLGLGAVGAVGGLTLLRDRVKRT